MAEVLLVEDDRNLSEPLARALRREGYGVYVLARGQGVLEETHRCGPDLVILDLGLPDVDGLDVCRKLRSSGIVVPILVLTGRADETTTIVALDAGADDYITKPFRLAELVARVRSLLRRTQPPQLLDGHLVKINYRARLAYLGDRELVLTAKEFDLLSLLHAKEGRALFREYLMSKVWGVTKGPSKTLDTHISSLRDKLGDDAHDPSYIFTVRGVGFRFHNILS